MDFPEDLLKEVTPNVVYVDPPLGLIYKQIWDLCVFSIFGCYLVTDRRSENDNHILPIPTEKIHENNCIYVPQQQQTQKQ